MVAKSFAIVDPLVSSINWYVAAGGEVEEARREGRGWVSDCGGACAHIALCERCAIYIAKESPTPRSS